MRRKVSDYNRTILILLFVGICIWGVVTSIQMNMVNRSLWLDEAMLSYSFSKRSLLNLWNGPFEADQIAPLGWLYFEKILSLIFGNTEFVLHTGSVLAYAVTIAELFYILRTCFGTSAVTASAAAAMYANLPFVLKYATDSEIFNLDLSNFSGIIFHNSDCCFKLFRWEVVDPRDLYGELHRYIPVLAHRNGFK